MNDIEILKLVKRNNAKNNYRAVLDKTLVDDIKYYSEWGDSSSLYYDVYYLLLDSESLNLLRNGNSGNIKKISYSRFIKARITPENKIIFSSGVGNRLEINIKDFFILYDKYNELILNGAHEIILKREGDKFSCEGRWYTDDSPFNKLPNKKIFKAVIKSLNQFISNSLDLIIDKDQYSYYMQNVYYSFQELYPRLRLNNISYNYIGEEEKYYRDIKDNIDKLIGETISDKNYVSIEVKSKDTLKINLSTLEMNEEEAPVFEINLDRYFNIYFAFKDLEEQNADEIIFIEENDEIKLEGVWYDNKNNKIKIS